MDCGSFGSELLLREIRSSSHRVSSTSFVNLINKWRRKKSKYLLFSLQAARVRPSSPRHPEFLCDRRTSCPSVHLFVQLPLSILQCREGDMEQWWSATTGGQHTPGSSMPHSAPHYFWGQFVCPSWGCGTAATCMWRRNSYMCFNCSIILLYSHLTFFCQSMF